MNKPTILAILATAGVAYSAGLQAAPPSPAKAVAEQPDASIVLHVGNKNGALLQGTAQLRTFRPTQVPRIRPLIGKSHVRPGRPHAHRSFGKHHGPFRQRQQPHRPPYVHVVDEPTPEVRPVASEDHTRDIPPLSPDFCRYWGDRGDISGEPCW